MSEFLPNEVISKIMSYLNDKDLIISSSVSKLFYDYYLINILKDKIQDRYFCTNNIILKNKLIHIYYYMNMHNRKITTLNKNYVVLPNGNVCIFNIISKEISILPGVKNIISITDGNTRIFMLDNNGDVYYLQNEKVDKITNLSDIVQIQSSQLYTIFLNSKGESYLNYNNLISNKIVLIEKSKNIKEIISSGENIYFLSKNGDMFTYRMHYSSFYSGQKVKKFFASSLPKLFLDYDNNLNICDGNFFKIKTISFKTIVKLESGLSCVYILDTSGLLYVIDIYINNHIYEKIENIINFCSYSYGICCLSKDNVLGLYTFSLDHILSIKLHGKTELLNDMLLIIDDEYYNIYVTNDYSYNIEEIKLIKLT